MSRSDAHIHIPDFRSTVHKAPRKGVPNDELEEPSEAAPENEAMDAPRRKPSKHGSEKHNTLKEKQS